MMEDYYSNRNPLLVFLLLSCLLLPLVSSVPLSRSLSLRNHHQGLPSLQVAIQDTTKIKGQNAKGVVERMIIEVNDYPASGANNRHDPPKSPGRV